MMRRRIEKTEKTNGKKGRYAIAKGVPSWWFKVPSTYAGISCPGDVARAVWTVDRVT